MNKVFKVKNFSILSIENFLTLLVNSFLRVFIFFSIFYQILINNTLTKLLLPIIATLVIFHSLSSQLFGEIVDKYSKKKLLLGLKYFNLILLFLVYLFAKFSNIYLGILLLFLNELKISFFYPLKYSYLVKIFKKGNIIFGDLILQSLGCISVILGIIVSVYSFFHLFFLYSFICLIFLLSVISIFMFLKFDNFTEKYNSKIKFNTIKTLMLIKKNIKNNDLFLTILVKSFSIFNKFLFFFLMFFLYLNFNISSKFLSVILLFLLIGNIFGTLLYNKLSKGILQSTYIPIGLFFVSISIFYIGINISNIKFIDKLSLSNTNIIFIFFLSFLFSLFQNLYSVPLNSIIEFISKEKNIGKIFSYSNIVSSFFILLSFLFIFFSLKFKLSLHQIFYFIALFNFIVFLISIKVLSGYFLKSILQILFYIFYRVKIEGLENFYKAGKKVIIIANHTSLLDGVLIGTFIPTKIMYAINTNMISKWFVKPFLNLANFFPIDPTNSMTLKSMIDEVNKNKICLIFPEGRITTTGSLMKVYEGSGLLADKTKANILPIRIDGAQRTKFSYLKKKFRTYYFPKITLKIMYPRKFFLPNNIIGRDRRKYISKNISNIMAKLVYESSNIKNNLFVSLLNTKYAFGGNKKILEDINRKEMSIRDLILKSYILGEGFKTYFEDLNIGILLPNTILNVVSLFGLISIDKIPTMLNFSNSPSTVLTTCKIAKIKTIITAHKFINEGQFQELEKLLLNNNINLIYLEDFKKKISFFIKFKGIIKYILKMKPKNKGNDPAVILFTSGSEGTPKGVILSHKNIQANRYQASSVIALSSNDIMFNALPMFHSFGLSTATFLPILFGMKTFLFPSPLKYKIISELCYDVGATILLGTNTFLEGYGKNAHPYDFFNMKYVVCGGEKLKESTFLTWINKFGIRILEGYGATETSPIISINVPMNPQQNSVGCFLPGIKYKLETIEGIENGKKLYLKGDNIMLGYLKEDKPGIIQPLSDGWYDTGDVVEINEDGFIFIKDRLKRFAKIGGEMVSLTMVENIIGNIIGYDFLFAITSIPNDKKGEELVLISQKKITLEEIFNYYKKNSIIELLLPKKIINIEEFPLLGNGKINYIKIKKIAISLLKL